MKVSQQYIDDKINAKLKQVDDLYYKAKEDLVANISQISNLALKNMENGEISKAIDRFEEIVQNLNFDNK